MGRKHLLFFKRKDMILLYYCLGQRRTYEHKQNRQQYKGIKTKQKHMKARGLKEAQPQQNP